MRALLFSLLLGFVIPAIADHQALITWIKIQPDHAFGSADTITSMDGCIVRAPAPKDENDEWAFYVLGHEVAHCFKGQYHPKSSKFGFGEWDEPVEKK